MATSDSPLDRNDGIRERGSLFRRPSLVLRIGTSITLIALLAMTSILVSIAIAEMSSGEARAINTAGSLRMQTYVLGVVIGRPSQSADHRMATLLSAMTEFESRYAAEELQQIITARSDDSKRGAYREVRDYWDTELRPAALAAGESGVIGDALQSAMREQVTRIDHLVALIEQSLESKLHLLRLVQAMSLMVLLLVGAIAVYQLKDRVLLPLRDLLRCAGTVRGGDFSVRVVPHEDDELGRLGDAFNFMVQDLSQIYAKLETRVQEKTDQLARSNRSLELLYGTSRALSERSASRETLMQVLAELERATGARGGAVVVMAAQAQAPRSLAADVDGRMLDQLAGLAVDPQWLAQTESRTVDLGGTPEPLQAIAAPLSDTGQLHGALVMVMDDGELPESWKVQLVEAVARHIGAALDAERRDEERHRLMLLDERSVIARELHDSLAQSLTYLNIQVTRLQKLLPTDEALDPVRGVVQELKEGLSQAYRQLRELLTTFRLRIDGRGLNTAIDETVQEFSHRAGLTIDLSNRLEANLLESSEEIHVLQVIREALANIEHHANAKRVSIHLEHDEGSRVRVTVDDDGIGIDRSVKRSNRYGIVIMRDRAQNLNGTLSVRQRPNGGTRVSLEFPARARIAYDDGIAQGAPA